MNHIGWALLGMLGYSLTTLFVKLATRDGQFSSFLVLAIAVSIVFASALTIGFVRGDIQAMVSNGSWISWNGAFAVATGIVLATAVISLFRALSIGPASTVVPIYGMFIVGGAILGFVFLHEQLSTQKIIGIVLACVSMYLIARG